MAELANATAEAEEKKNDYDSNRGHVKFGRRSSLRGVARTIMTTNRLNHIAISKFDTDGMPPVVPKMTNKKQDNLPDRLFYEGIERDIAVLLSMIFLGLVHVGKESLPRSHWSELMLGTKGSFNVNTSSMVAFIVHTNFGQVVASWLIGMLFMFAMMPVYWSGNVAAKFSIHPPLKRSWTLHIGSGGVACICAFMTWFVHLPQPLAQFAAVLDVIHFCATWYQMRILQFGKRDHIIPMYMTLMLTKLFCAAVMFAFPLDGMASLRYGLVLCAFSWQRLFLFAQSKIYGRSRVSYCIATLYCGIVGMQSFGVLNTIPSYVMCQYIYVRFLKGIKLIGSGKKENKSDDVETFTLVDLRTPLFEARNLAVFSLLTFLAGGSESGHEGCMPKRAHSQGVIAMLARMGFDDNQISAMLIDFGLDTQEYVTHDLVMSNPHLSKFIEALFRDMSEAVANGAIERERE